MKKILPFFSYLFHPIFLGIYALLGYLALCESTFETSKNYYLVLQVAIVSCFIPLLVFYILLQYNLVKSIFAVSISERKIPLVIQSFLLIFLIKSIVRIDNHPNLHFFFLGVLLSTLICLLLLFINTKASIHLMASSALTWFFFGLSVHFQMQNALLIGLLMVANGVLVWSRIAMKAHTFKEIVIGFLLGSLPQMLLWYFWV